MKPPKNESNLIKFKSCKSMLVFVVLIAVFLTFTFSTFLLVKVDQAETFKIVIWIGFMVLISTLLWVIWFGTFYLIEGSSLIISIAYIKKRIDISSIKSLDTKVSYYVGLKAGLSHKGIVIEYNRFDDIYISPDRIKDFIKAVKAINPNVLVK